MIYVLIALAGVGALAGWMLRQRGHVTPYPDAKTLIIEPPSDVTVKRLDNGDYEFRWSGDKPPVTIYSGATLDSIDRTAPLATTSREGAVVVSGVSAATRPYFEVSFGDDTAQSLGERMLSRQTVRNLRDLGGYTTTDGRRVRWGKVYRSGNLSRLSDDDLRYLQDLGIKTVCDLRSYREVERSPTRVPSGAAYVHLPLAAENESIKQLRAVMFNKSKLPTMLVDGYTRVMLDANAPLYGGILRRLADPEQLPTLIHCAAGKDRTGVASALLLLALGVPEDVVIADYTLSNHYFESSRMVVEESLKRIRWLRIGVDDLTPLLLAEARSMQATLDYLRAKYGSVETYLREAAGVDAATIEALKANLLN